MFPIAIRQNKRREATNILQLNAITRAIESYDGSIDFDLWLNLPTTTRSMMRHVDEILKRKAQTSAIYFQEIGIQGGKKTCGDMAGRITVMLPIGLLREMFLNHKNNLYKNEEEFIRDCSKLKNFLRLYVPFELFVDGIRIILDYANDIARLTDLITMRYLTDYGHQPIKSFTYYLRKFYFDQFYTLLKYNRYSADFLAAYCIGALDKLHMIKLDNIYWTDETCHGRLKEICTFYQQIMQRDKKFVELQFPYTLYRFLRKKDPLSDQLHALYVKQKIYSGALFFLPLNTVISQLLQYEKDSGIQIHVHPVQLKKFYEELPHHDFMWANVHLNPVIIIEHANKI